MTGTPHADVDAVRPASVDALLLARYEERVVGAIERIAAGLRFTYAPAWRSAPGAFPLSLSLPMTQAEYKGEAVTRVLEAYLPDRTDVRERLARDHHVSASDVFGLLTVVGGDCPGAFQFVRPDRHVEPNVPVAPEVDWLTDAQLAHRLRALRQPGAPARFAGDAGYFSLAGAQPKIALYRADGQWGIPAGRTPTTHILKPPLGGKLGFLVAEFIGLRLTAALELDAPEAEALRIEDQWVLAVTRYDRLLRDGRWRRIHQEDVCQALGESPFVKYEKGGAPGIVNIVALLREHSAQAATDVGRFLDMIALNWLIIGTDAHARNYSLLIGANGDARLAPFYDVATVLGLARPREIALANLAMQIGGEYRAFDIGRTQWEQLATAVRVPTLVQRVEELAHRVSEVCATVAAQIGRDAEPKVLLEAERQLTRIARRATDCARTLG